MVEGFYLAVGPTTISVIRGEVEVLGYRVEEGHSFVVPAGRQVPLRVSGEVSARPSSDSLRLDARGSYAEFERVAEEAMKGKRVLLIGPVDVGKSTLSAWIINKAAAEGRNMAYLTVDVGQNEVFCPGFAALGIPQPPVIPGYAGSFRQVRPCFVGSFSPAEALDKYLRCASELAGEPQALVIDTDGWVGGEEALQSKVKLAQAVGADAVVLMGMEGKEGAFRELGIEVISVGKLAGKEKSREERRAHRERLIAQKLMGARQRLLRAEEVELEGLEVFRGRRLELKVPSIIYAEQSPAGDVILVYRGEERPPFGEGVKVLHDSWERGLLVALVGSGVHVGALDKIYYDKRVLRVITAYEGPVKRLEVGRARVDLRSLGL
ncbi:MAG: Clp1/GlmU family protein [Acidilobaceae archaeon]|nr:Clp1/GlmU family protein [Acidilobaceae archaeon]